nr:hypothetical protein [uncultured Chitinophaga sp.]
MENKLYRYILVLEILLVTAVFGLSWLADNLGATALSATAPDISSRYETISLPFGWLYQLDKLPNMIYRDDPHGSVIDMFVSPAVWLLTSCLWGGVSYAVLRLFRQKAHTTTPEGSFWKKVFLSNLLVSLVAFAFVFVLRSRYAITISPTEEIYSEFYLFCLAAIAGSFLLGSCWWLIARLWQRHRAISVMLSGVTLTGMLAVIVAAYALSTYEPYCVTEDDAPQAAAATTDLVETNVETTAAPVYATEAVDTATPEIPEAWKGPEPPGDSIRAALQFICYDQLELGKNNPDPTDLILNWGLGIRSLFAQHDRATKEDAVKQFNTTSLAPVVEIFDFTGRDGQRLKACFGHFGPHLRQVIPTVVYRRSPASRYIDNLLATHEYLQEMPDYRASLKTLYEKMKVPPGDIEPQAETYINDIAFTGGLEDIDAAIAKGDRQGKRLAVWLVSFWARRYEEGNAAEVHYILRKIADIYGGAG